MYGMKPKPATEPSSITNYLPLSISPTILSSQTNTKPGNNADVVKHRSPDHDYSATIATSSSQISSPGRDFLQPSSFAFFPPSKHPSSQASDPSSEWRKERLIQRLVS
ncbi:uncharacterized protein RCO7_14461 [Rhynchosporium graminicola]|uniref:Uncharacterized protein n=1 Tax=Rhynchosporium graminicola TaxID=2792576 RepID=A0A1E1KJ59_9HELO|nr:uncharacterized protein RCO7_14461 [Rhynchosporium commune]